ncbi:hypothetical protein DFJ58DRAFT_723125 [Suillus subalutaceus]|uniref:uncharacterized protein n=1 Tax=Suillus subalutaceus TaxID=48586 RepID=UPI001B861B04|nr:uncharacterized protein DFJ58DRAFT_723125 [Suillus subalutaceus]KAG1870229.1 hypothetical protein DFJ58DRAFT_723125 [Suillus subalutaceus]
MTTCAQSAPDFSDSLLSMTEQSNLNPSPPLVMHPALTNLEVICTISSYTQHGSLPALASTCRAFKHLALNALWRDLQSVEPLVKCLPSDLFSIDQGRVVLQKPIDSKLWDTLFEYSSRVHSITVTQKSIPSTVTEPLSMLILSSPSTTASWFPNLHKLTWHADGTHIFAPFFAHGSSTVYVVLSSLGTLCPYLQNVTMSIPSQRQSDNFKLLHQISPFIARPISQLHHLHTLSIWDAGREITEHVMKIRAMQSLSLDLRTSSAWNEKPRFQFPGFDDLTWFSLSTETIEHASNVFRSLQIVKCKKIKVGITSHRETDWLSEFFSENEIATISQFLTILKERCDHDKLECFSLRIGYSKGLRTKWGDFTSLRAFPNLTHLLIEGAGNISISDETLCQLARAWPKLKALKISSFIVTDGTTKVPTFHGLINLLWCCPALTKLALVIDTTKSDGIDLKCPGGGRCNKRLEFLTLGNSRISGPVNVALIISGLFPYLKEVDLSCWERPPMNTTANRKADMGKWATVNMMLRGFSVAKERSIETWSDCL